MAHSRGKASVWPCAAKKLIWLIQPHQPLQNFLQPRVSGLGTSLIRYKMTMTCLRGGLWVPLVTILRGKKRRREGDGRRGNRTYKITMMTTIRTTLFQIYRRKLPFIFRKIKLITAETAADKGHLTQWEEKRTGTTSERSTKCHRYPRDRHELIFPFWIRLFPRSQWSKRSCTKTKAKRISRLCSTHSSFRGSPVTFQKSWLKVSSKIVQSYFCYQIQGRPMSPEYRYRKIKACSCN